MLLIGELVSATVAVKSNKAVGFIKILVQHVTSGQGDTGSCGIRECQR